MSATWTPGHRRVPGKLNPVAMHKRIVRHGSVGAIQVAQYEGDRTDLAGVFVNTDAGWTPEEGLNVLLSLKSGTKSRILINLTYLTEAELDVLKEFVVSAIEDARPSVQRRDAVAKEAEANGDYSFARSNRSDPKVTGRKGQSR